MNRTTIIVTVGLAFAAALSAAPAMAQNVRSFVSGQGVDGNSCTLAAPCRTFAFAITRTNAGGEILTLNPAGYGPVTIDKSISIVSSLGVGGINMLAAGTAITINAGSTDIVSLRGLNFDGLGFGSTGIVFNTGKSLTVANCVIRRFTGNGIEFRPNATSNLFVSNTLAADNNNLGIYVRSTGSGAVTAVFNRVEANNNGSTGIVVDGQFSTGTVKASVVDSVAAGNGEVGFRAIAFAGHAPTTLMLFHSVAANNNGYGLVVSGTGATARAFQTMVTGNANGWFANDSGVVQSYGNNAIDGNGDGDPAPPSIAQK